MHIVGAKIAIQERWTHIAGVGIALPDQTASAGTGVS